MAFVTTTADQVSLPELTAAWNLVYTGYSMPVTFTPEQLRARIEQYDLRPDQSTLMLDEQGEVIGLALLGLRGDRAWLGGFGIAPAYRGRGLSHPLLVATQNWVQQAGATQLQLEVITTNRYAVETYRRGGFLLRRHLLMLGRAADQAALPGDHRSVVAADPAVLLDAAPALHGSPPCWQRQPASLYNEPASGLVIGDPLEPEGYVLYRITPQGIRLIDLAARTPNTVAPLLGAILAEAPGSSVVLVNEPDDSPLLPVLEHLGFRESLRQYELVWDSPGPPAVP